MDFTYTTEQTALRDAVRALLTGNYGSIDGRRAATEYDPGFSEAVWLQLAEMGVLGLPFPEEDGGSGAGPIEVAIVAEEIGRVLAPEPFVEAVVLAGGLLAATGASTAELAAGEMIPSYAGGPGVTAVYDRGQWRLTGEKKPVLNGQRADLVVVTADIDGRPGVFAVRGDTVARTGFKTFDGGRAARVEFVSTPAELLAEDAAETITAVESAARISYAHESIGSMTTALTLTSDYLTTREQFGVPLKAFQSLTHRAADMYVALELARSVAMWGSLVLLDAGDDRELVVDAGARAKLQSSRAGRLIGKEVIQLHGGIGMTMEYAAGHHSTRLTAIEHTLGDGRQHLASLASTVGDHRILIAVE